MQCFIISCIHGGNHILATLLFPFNISYYCIIKYNKYTIHIINIDTHMGQYTYRDLVKHWLALIYIPYITCIIASLVHHTYHYLIIFHHSGNTCIIYATILSYYIPSHHPVPKINDTINQ